MVSYLLTLGTNGGSQSNIESSSLEDIRRVFFSLLAKYLANGCRLIEKKSNRFVVDEDGKERFCEYSEKHEKL